MVISFPLPLTPSRQGRERLFTFDSSLLPVEGEIEPCRDRPSGLSAFANLTRWTGSEDLPLHNFKVTMAAT